MAVTQKLQRYVLREYIVSIAMTFAIILSAILLVDVVEQMRTISDKAELSILGAVQLTVMKAPMLIEHTMPFLILVASILTFNRLSRLAELPAMRAAGMSAWRFLAPVVLIAGLLGVLTVTVINPLGANLNAQFEQRRADMVGESSDGVVSTRNGVWLRQGSEINQFVIHSLSAERGGTLLKDVKFFEYERIYSGAEGTDDFAFKRRIEADSATLKAGFWELENVLENIPGKDPIRTSALSIPTDLDPSKLLDRFASTSTIGFWDLQEFIDDTRRAGLDALRYEMHQHSLWALPLLYISMAMIGAPVCLRLARLGGAGRLIAWGAFTAVILFFVTELSQSLGAAGAAPTVISAFAPPLFALFASLTAIAYLEDG